MKTLLEPLGAAALGALIWLGRVVMHTGHLMAVVTFLFSRPRLVIVQLYYTGVLSLPIILVAGLFVGMVLALQGYTNLVQFGAENTLGVVVALALVRELGPVLSALLYAGRAGTALTAEVALMKTTEQLSSMEMMAVDPYRRVLAPRFVGGILALPLLATLFTAVGIAGAFALAVGQLGIDGGTFWSQTQRKVEFVDDVINGVIVKSIVFSVVVNAIAVFEGFDATPTAAGIGRATTRTVVNASLAVLALDFLLTAVLFGGL